MYVFEYNYSIINANCLVRVGYHAVNVSKFNLSVVINVFASKFALCDFIVFNSGFF